MVVWYTEDHLTMQQIADRVGISRAAVHKRLKRAGVKSQEGEHVEVACATCGRPYTAERARARHQARHYCSQDCYFAARMNPALVLWRRGGKIARLIVSQHFRLRPEYVVHHKDGDERNNDRANLLVFASTGDHSRYHHAVRTGRPAPTPLWDGAVS